MARYKLIDRSPRFLPIVLESQLIPGSFEHALDVLIDTEIDLARLGARFCNDPTGAPAYDPAVMLKIVLLAYSRGVISSRAIERLCRENVLFMAISGDSAPRFTTIAAFVRELGEDAAAIFTQVLLTCDRLGLIGRQMFAIDGVKLPSNADKRRSGTHAELRHEAERMEVAVATMMKAHRARDEQKDPGEDQAKDRARTERLQSEARRIREFLATHAERRSEKGAIRKSNLTDNDSAKMATAKGVLQGYTAVAAVDAKAQIIVAAQAHGSGSEQSALLPMVRSTEALRTEQTMVTADAGYHSEESSGFSQESPFPSFTQRLSMKSTSSRSAKLRHAKRKSSSAVSRTDWARVTSLRDRDIRRSSEHPEADLRHIVRGIARRGLRPLPAKASISLRLDNDVLQWFKAQGPGYQTRINAVLRAFRDASV